MHFDNIKKEPKGAFLALTVTSADPRLLIFGSIKRYLFFFVTTVNRCEFMKKGAGTHYFLILEKTVL